MYTLHQPHFWRLQDGAPLTAVSFSASGTGLIAANASNHIGVFNIETLSATDWMKAHGTCLPARLLDMPGSIASISVHPQVRTHSSSIPIIIDNIYYLQYAMCARQ